MRQIVERLKEDDSPRGQNRARIIDKFNGNAPYTDQEARENNIFTNVQPLMAPRLAHDARRQLSGAANRTTNFFKVTVDTGNEASDSVASFIITKKINRVMKQSRKYLETLRGQDANVVLHGKGAVIWDDPNYWCPKVIGVEDLKVPAGTYIDFSNLTHFAIYEEWSAAELMRKVSGKRVYPGWNVSAVKTLIKKLVEDGTETESDHDEFPEKLAESFKENGVFYASDKVPTVKCWRFYELEDERTGPRWKYYIFQDESKVGDKDEFLFEQKRGFVEEIDRLVHVQYADGNNVAPFRYHSVRGLGYLLYPLVHLNDRLFCRAMDAFFEACNQLFRSNSEEDRERLQSVMLSNMGVVPSGIAMVPATERYTVNHNLLNAAFGMLRQYVSENSTSFTQDSNDGTKKEMTATETLARVQQATAMMNSMLSMQYTYRAFQFREIARRFTIKPSKCKDVEKFQAEIAKEGLGPEHLDYEKWTVVPEQIIGGGNKTLELAMAKELMAARPLYPPQAQTEILREYTLATTDDADKAVRWVPAEPKPPSSSTIHANVVFGTLMDGGEVILPEGINLDEYAQVLMLMLSKQLEMIGQSGATPSVDKVMGLQQTGRHIGEVLQQLAQDPAKEQMMGEAMSQLQQMMQKVAELADAAIEQQQASAGGNQELQAKLYEKKALADAAADVIRGKGDLQRQQKEESFQQKLTQNIVKLQSELEAKDYATAQELRSKRVKTDSEVAAMQRKTTADVEAMKRKAASAPKSKD